MKDTVKKMIKCYVISKNRIILSNWVNVRGACNLEFEVHINELENNGEEYSIYKKQNGKFSKIRETWYFQGI